MTSRIRIGNAVAQLNALRDRDLARRQRATTILEPEHLAGTNVAAAHVLQTTLDGERRPITQKDLATFRASVAQLGNKLRGGITIEEAINLSRPIDVKRAREEIRYAAPTLVSNGEVRFLTDSGPNSRVSRHHTAIAFVEWSAAIARPATPLQAAAWLCREGRLMVSCECEAFTFWGFRYIATLGGFVLGRRETGFPKIRQPTLSGCLCKHLLRTVAVLQADPIVHRRIAQAIDLERKRLERPAGAQPVAVRITQAEADRITAGPVRRIAIRQGNVPPPTRATDDAIRRAMAQLKERPDGGVLLAALENMLRQQPGAR
jgi:hypothetical protein